MTKKYVGVFDATLIYQELIPYFPFPTKMPCLLQQVTIAYLISRECHVEFSEEVRQWYDISAFRIVPYNLSSARRVFHECFDYFLFGAMNFENVHLQFIGHTVFVSNYPFSLKNLNRRS